MKMYCADCRGKETNCLYPHEVEVTDGLKEKSGELFSAYRAFCGRTNDFCRSTTKFYTSLEQRGFIRRKRSIGMFVHGLKLAETESDF